MKITSHNLPKLLSGLVVIIVTLWMLSGLGRNPEQDEGPDDVSATSGADSIQQVRVQKLLAEEITREIKVSGRTEPNRSVDVRAETDGTVMSIQAERGGMVKSGSPLVVLDMRDRNSRLEEAAALVAQRELEFAAIENLRGRQYTTEVQIAEARARLESARASFESIQLEISNTAIKAPFDAMVQERNVEIGDFVREGDTVAVMVDLDPLIVVGEVNEREVSALAIGGRGKATLIDGTELEGTVRYLSPVAEPNTRSFKVELAVPNSNAAVRAGLTSEIRLYADKVKVHTLSAALLSLADDGTVGVKVVDGNDTVQFYPVEIADSGKDGMLVTGLPDSINLITVGQGFVTPGQKVEPVTMVSPESAATYERPN